MSFISFLIISNNLIKTRCT